MPAATDIMTPLWRGVVALRTVTAAFAIGSILVHQDLSARPAIGWALLGAIAVWTAVSCVAYSYPASRRTPVVVVDLVVTLAVLASSLLVLPTDQLTAATPLLTGVWACGPVVAAAVQAGRFAGVLSGVAVTAVDAWVHGGFTTEVARDAVLLVATGFGFGLAATTARWSSEQLRRAARAEVATAERERVARSIHDSVLGVLARLQAADGQNGRLVGDAAELTRLAGEQEVALRSLITTPAPGAAISGENDLGAALQELAGSKVEVSVPAAGVPLPAADVEELVALTRVALADTARHTGPETKSWVLVEDLGGEIVLTVRDDGDADSRSELSREIRDRIADLGGTLTHDAGPGQGAEWQVRLARTRRLHR